MSPVALYRTRHYREELRISGRPALSERTALPEADRDFEQGREVADDDGAWAVACRAEPVTASVSAQSSPPPSRDQVRVQRIVP